MFPFRETDRTLVLIDGIFIYRCAEDENATIDFARLRDFFHEEMNVLRMDYFSTYNRRIPNPNLQGLPDEEYLNDTTSDNRDPNYIPMKPLLDWLKFNGFNVNVVTHNFFMENGKRINENDNLNFLKTTTNIVDLMMLSIMQTLPAVDHVVLFSNHLRMQPVLEILKGMNKKTTIIGNTRIHDDLRSGASHYMHIKEILEYVKKVQKD